jgi:hypothetical protein
MTDFAPGPYLPGPVQQPTPPSAPTPPRRSRAVPILVVALVVLAGAVAALTFALISNRANAKPSTPAAAASAPAAIFEQARGDCKVTSGFEIEDGGKTLNVTVAGAYMATDTMTCVFGELQMPDAVRQHVGSTRALDGQQTDSWPGYTARWTYHPDDGLQMTIRTDG